MRNWPLPSVVAVRTFSINTGLAASTVTPGSTAPEVSFTTPVMEACAIAAAGTSTAATSPARILPILRIDLPPCLHSTQPDLTRSGLPGTVLLLPSRTCRRPLLTPSGSGRRRVDHGAVPVLDELSVAYAERVERERLEQRARRRGGLLP